MTDPMIEGAREISLDAVADRLGEPWQPIDLAAVNEASVRLVRLEGDFPWHEHLEDELFLCWRGVFRLEMRERTSIQLSAGELFVVPRGIEHRPVADVGPAHAVLV
ncbi:MAG TPA: cupin domain-containing protein, partial [Candidatus Limnocylindria bacterium]